MQVTEVRLKKAPAEDSCLAYGSVTFDRDFEGNIDFYGKSGFDYASQFGVRYHGLPEGADASFFLCKELEKGYLDGVTGEYAPPQCYFVDEKEAEEFDKEFSPKEKLRLEGQIF